MLARVKLSPKVDAGFGNSMNTCGSMTMTVLNFYALHFVKMSRVVGGGVFAEAMFKKTWTSLAVRKDYFVGFDGGHFQFPLGHPNAELPRSACGWGFCEARDCLCSMVKKKKAVLPF